MNTFQIDKILKRNIVTKRFYVGCFASDCIPYRSSFFPFCVVVNTDPSNLSGTHWIALFCNSTNSIEYYDSLGIWPPISYHIRTYLDKFNNVQFNSVMLQQPFSITCGNHVILFLYMRCLGFSMNKIISLLKGINADKFVSEFISTQIFNINR